MALQFECSTFAAWSFRAFALHGPIPILGYRAQAGTVTGQTEPVGKVASGAPEGTVTNKIGTVVGRAISYGSR